MRTPTKDQKSVHIDKESVQGGRRFEVCLRGAWGKLGGCLQCAWVAREDRTTGSRPPIITIIVLTHPMTPKGSVDIIKIYNNEHSLIAQLAQHQHSTSTKSHAPAKSKFQAPTDTLANFSNATHFLFEKKIAQVKKRATFRSQTSF